MNLKNEVIMERLQGRIVWFKVTKNIQTYLFILLKLWVHPNII